MADVVGSRQSLQTTALLYVALRAKCRSRSFSLVVSSPVSRLDGVTDSKTLKIVCC